MQEVAGVCDGVHEIETKPAADELHGDTISECHRSVTVRVTSVDGLDGYQAAAYVVTAMSILRGYALPLLVLLAASTASAREPLHLQVFVAGPEAYNVTSTLIYGSSEGVLVDAQARLSDAKNLAANVASTGVHLKAILVTHPDFDHYIGLGVLHERFPEAPIYMSAAALAEFTKTVDRSLAYARKSFPGEIPDSLPAPTVLPFSKISVDGNTIEILNGLQGDYAAAPSNSIVWIPSMRAVIADDVVFNEVHPWLYHSTAETREGWRKSLDRIAALQPDLVIAGHKKSGGLPDTPDVLAFMGKYLKDFDREAKRATSRDAFIAAMKKKYDRLGQERFLDFAAETAFPGAP